MWHLPVRLALYVCVCVFPFPFYLFFRCVRVCVFSVRLIYYQTELTLFVQFDPCGVCGGDGQSCADCMGVPNGGMVKDACGICGGDGTECAGCDGVPRSGKVLDACGNCLSPVADADLFNRLCADCMGVPFGNATVRLTSATKER